MTELNSFFSFASKPGVNIHQRLFCKMLCTDVLEDRLDQRQRDTGIACLDCRMDAGKPGSAIVNPTNSARVWTFLALYFTW